MGNAATSRMLGNLSLGVMASGMIAVEALLHAQVIAGIPWRILATGFEAGTVGAIADWYAVRAMFHPIPLPILGRHSNILVRNRARITDAIVDAVQNKWLSAQAIGQFLERQSPAALALAYLSEESHQQQILAGVRSVLRGVIAQADQSPAEALLEQAIRDQLRQVDIAPALGRWLTDMIQAGRHQALWTSLLGTLQAASDDPHMRVVLAGTMQRAVTRYAQSGTLRRMGRKVMEAVGVIDYHAMADSALAELRLFLDQARGNPSHALRRKVDDALLAWARDLSAGRGEATAIVNQWRDRLVDQAQLAPLVRAMLGRLRQTLVDQLADEPPGRVMPVIEGFLRGQLQQLRDDQARQQRVDQWVRQRLPEWVARYSHVIGEVVRGKLAAAGDEQWVREIEDNVGGDLQYIRLNGAVVGFGVGLILATARWLLLG